MADSVARRLRNAHFMQLLKSGIPMSTACEQCSITVQTGIRIATDNKDEVEEHIEEMDSILDQRAREAVNNAAQKLYLKADRAAERVGELIESMSGNTALRASFGILDRVGLGARKPLMEEPEEKPQITPEMVEMFVKCVESLPKAVEVNVTQGIMLNGQVVQLQKGETLDTFLMKKGRETNEEHEEQPIIDVPAKDVTDESQKSLGPRVTVSP